MIKSGTIVGEKYAVRHLIAEGGMSEVYVAENVESKDSIKNLYAVKRLLPRLAQQDIFVQLFYEEANLAISLRHPYIVSSYEFIEESGNYYLVMEYIRGKELQVFGQAHFDVSFEQRIVFAKAIGEKVLEALSYVHEKTDSQGKALNLVHGDISPQNIMVTIDGSIKIYDFLAIGLGGYSRELIRGNIRYMSPEQVRGDTVTLASDIYSLTKVLLEFILKKNVNKKNNYDARLILKSYNFASDVYQFLEQGLAPNPQERFSSAEAMKQALLQIAPVVMKEQMDELVKHFLLRIETVSSAKAKGRHEYLSSASYFVAASIVFLLLLWVSLSVLSGLFEPQHYHHIPYWTAQEVDQNEALAQHTDETIDSPPLRAESMGTLSVQVDPWADVYVDGVYAGRTPMKPLSLSAGKHVIQLKNPHISTVALRVVTIYAGVRTDFAHNLIKEGH